MNDRALKFWSCHTSVMRGHSKSWDRCNIAAYSLKDAVQLYVQAGGSERGAVSQLTNYSTRWGTMVDKLIPNPRRGIYFTDEMATSLMYIEPETRSIIEDIPEEAKVEAAKHAAPEDYGKLRVGFERGVKVDEWTFSSPFLDRALADRMKAVVRMQNATKRNVGANGGIEFVATSDCFKGRPLSSPNIEKLFEMVQEEFRTYDIAQRGVVWEDWLEIAVHQEDVYGAELSAGLSVGYSKLKRGVDPRNGRVMTINNNHVVTDFPKARAAGAKPKRDEDGWNLGDKHQLAYLPATPENIAALDTIMAAVNTARVRLEALLNQRDISKTLASMPTVPLLESRG